MKINNIRCKYFLWYYIISLLFHSNISKIYLQLKSSKSHQTLTCDEMEKSESRRLGIEKFCYPKYTNLNILNFL